MTNSDVGSGKSVLLDVRGLKKYFPIRRGILQKTIGHVKAVDDVTFFLNRGETLSLVGRERLREDHDGALHPARHQADGRPGLARGQR